MIFFNNIRPRRYNHVMIYSDERKERLKAIEERARRELGMSPPAASGHESLRGAFTERAARLRKRSDGRRRKGVGNGVIIAAILALLLLLRYLIAG